MKDMIAVGETVGEARLDRIDLKFTPQYRHIRRSDLPKGADFQPNVKNLQRLHSLYPLYAFSEGDNHKQNIYGGFQPFKER